MPAERSKETAPKGGKSTKGTKGEPLFFRLPGRVKRMVDKATAKKPGGGTLTQAQFFQRLVEYYDGLPEDLQDKLINGDENVFIDRFTQILAWTNVCNHSFQLGRWIRSIRDHDELVGKTKKFPSLLQWTEYRRCFVVASLADQLRLDGLFLAVGIPADSAANWKDYYFWASQALGKALDQLQTIRELVEVPALFNQACAFTLRAQFQIEAAFLDERLGEGSRERLESIVEQEAWEGMSHKGRLTDEASQRLLKLVVGAANGDALAPRVRESVKADLQNALERIRQLGAVIDEESRGWIRDSLKRDPELRLLREADASKGPLNDLLKEIGGEVGREQWLRKHFGVPPGE